MINKPALAPVVPLSHVDHERQAELISVLDAAKDRIERGDIQGVAVVTVDRTNSPEMGYCMSSWEALAIYGAEGMLQQRALELLDGREG